MGSVYKKFCVYSWKGSGEMQIFLHVLTGED